MIGTHAIKNGAMSIGQAARAAGVAATTLRFYERKGILAPTVRTQAGYRLYDEQAVERLHFIRSAQAVGFTLEDIRALLDIDDQVECQTVQAMIERRLCEVDAKMTDLQRVRTTLADALERCRRSKKGCAVVADLKKAHVPRGST